MDYNFVLEKLNNAGFNFQECKIIINDSGVDFKVFHLTDNSGIKWIVKIPRRNESLRNVIFEKNLLDCMRPEIDFEVPSWQIVDDKYIVYKQLSGKPLADINVESQMYDWNIDTSDIPEAYIESFSKKLVGLHNLNYDYIKKSGIKQIEANQFRNVMLKRIEKVSKNYEININLKERWMNWLNDTTFWPNHTGLSHGDLHPGHILLNDQLQINGIIDWSESTYGDVSVDFLSHYLLLGEKVLDKILEFYSNHGGKTWGKMKEHIVELLSTSPITVAEYAETSGLDEMRTTAQSMLLNPE